MKGRLAQLAGLMTMMLLFAAACDEGVDDWNSSAKVTGYVYTDASHSRGVEGVQVILESDQTSQSPYKGPDRWTVTDASGHFEGAVFLGNDGTSYNYLGDMAVGYFWKDKGFRWTGGISVGPGSVFTLPAVDTTMFSPLVTHQ
jgi:hypothetical protein